MYGNEAPLQINSTNVWRGTRRTNGFVMRNADGRIPAIKQSFTRLMQTTTVGIANALGNMVPFGTGLWRDIDNIDTQQGTLHVTKPAKGLFAGILEFNQGMQTGHPVAISGLMPYGKGEVITSGLVGYKSALSLNSGALTSKVERYITWLKDADDKALDVSNNRSTYDDWVKALKAGADGCKLALFIHTPTGLPYIGVVEASRNPFSNTELAFVGVVEIFEPENKAVYVNIDTVNTPMFALV